MSLIKSNEQISKTEYDLICKRLGCTMEQLEFCIRRVGRSIISVEAFFMMNKDRIKFMYPGK